MHRFHHFRDSEWIKAVVDWQDAVQMKENRKADVIALLEKLFKNTQDHTLLTLKRRIYNDKNINWDKYSPDIVQALSSFKKVDEDCDEAYEKMHQLYENKLQLDRAALQRMFQQYDALSIPLPLINPDMHFKYKKYIHTPSEAHNAKLRKLDYPLSRILARSAVKSSPFSSFTSVELVKIGTEPNENRKTTETTKTTDTKEPTETRKTEETKKTVNSMKDAPYVRMQEQEEPVQRLVTEINYFILQKIVQLLANDLYYAKQLSYRKSFSMKDNQDHVHFIIQVDMNGGKVFNNVEKKISMKNNFILDILFDALQQKGTLSYRELESLLRPHADEETITKLLFHGLIQKGILYPDICVNEYSEHVYEHFEHTLRSFDDKPGKVAATLEHTNKIMDLLHEFEHATGGQRFDIHAKMISEVKCLENLLHYTFPKDLMLYEDAVVSHSGEHYTLSKETQRDIHDVQKLALILNPAVSFQLEFAHHFYERYGMKEVALTDIEVRSLYLEVLQKYDSWNNVLAPVHLQSKTASQLEQIKDEIRTYFLSMKNRQDGVYAGIDKKQIATWYQTFKTMYQREEVLSSTVLLQQLNGEPVLNKMYTGSLRLFARFFEHEPSIYEDKDFQSYVNTLFGDQTINIRESYGFNANRHRNILPTRLIFDNSRGTENENETVHMNQLCFAFNEQLGLVDIKQKETGETVKVLRLGSLVDVMLPHTVQIVQDVISPIFDMNLMDLWDNSKKHFVTDHIPRMYVGNTIIGRERWLLDTSYFDWNAPSNEIAVQLATYFMQHALPMEFFSRPHTAQTTMNYLTMKRTELKPQYYNLFSPLFIKGFVKLCSNYTHVIVEEAFPSLSDYANNKEYQFEVIMGE